MARAQVEARHSRAASEADDIRRDAERQRAEKAERDRALEAARTAKARTAELPAQAR